MSGKKLGAGAKCQSLKEPLNLLISCTIDGKLKVSELNKISKCSSVRIERVKRIKRTLKAILK
jgi:hypothetical protein